MASDQDYQEVDLGEHGIARFPAKMPREQVQANLRKHFGKQDQIQFNPGFLEKLSPNIAAGTMQLGQSILNLPSNMARMGAKAGYVSPETAKSIPRQDYNFSEMLKLPGSTADKVMQELTSFAPSMALPAANLGRAGQVIEAIPKVGKFASNALGRIIPQAEFGLLTNENPGKGAMEQGGFQAGMELLPPVLKGAAKIGGKVLEPFQPQKYAAKFLESLGGGQTLEENAKIIARNVKHAYEKAEQKGSELYGSIFGNNGLGNRGIYREVNPSGVHQTAYLDRKPININASGKLKETVDAFNKNPTFQNAHALQSELGTEINTANPISMADKQEIGRYRSARQQIKNDIDKFLEEQHPIIGDQYKGATQFWHENVAPYTQNSKIKALAKGKTVNPDDILSTFSSPEPHTAKVVNDLGEEAKNRILFAHLGKQKTNLNSDRLLAEINKLDEKGLASYLHPGLEHQIAKLNQKTNWRDRAQNVAGAVLGYKAAQMMGLPPGLEGLLAAGTAYGSPRASKTFQAFLPSDMMQEAIGKHIGNMYQPTGRAAKAIYKSQGSDDNGTQP